MAQKRAKRAARRAPAPTGGIKFTPGELAAATQAAEKEVAKKMGIDPGKLSASVKAAVKAATAKAMSNRATTLIQRDADAVVKDTLLAGAKPLNLLDARMSAAKAGIHHVAGSSDVEGILQETATLLWKKFGALKSVGFTDEQAFELVLAEVSARAARPK